MSIINSTTAAAGIASGQRSLDAARRQGRIASGMGKAGKKGFSPAEDKRLRNVCTEMESLFVKQMLSTMRKTVKKSGLLHGGRAEEIFTDMLDDQYALKMSRTHSLGLAQMLYGQLSHGRKW